MNLVQNQLNNVEKEMKELILLTPSLNFEPVKVVLRGSIYLIDENSNNIVLVPYDSEIMVLGYYKGKVKVNYNSKIGYMYSHLFDNYENVKIQVEIRENEQRKIDSETKVKLEPTVEELALEEKIKFISKFKSLGSPVALNEASVTFNSIGNPEANLIIQNISNKIIDGYEVDVFCYDNYGRAVKHYLHKTNKFGGISQGEIGINEEDSSYWTLYSLENTTKITVFIRSVHFKNGTKWLPTKPVSIKSN